MDMEIVFPGGKRVDAIMGNMRIPTDQPVSAGGTGGAPAPFLLFLASIGTCAGIYVLGFCQSRGIDTQGIKIIQKMQVDPRTQLVRAVKLDIQLPEDFPEQYKSAVIKAAELCAVKKHLENPPEFQITTSSVSSETVSSAANGRITY